MRTTGWIALALLSVGCSASRLPTRIAAPASRADIDAGARPTETAVSFIDTSVVHATDAQVPCRPTTSTRVCLPAGLAQVGRAAPETHFEERPPRIVRLRAFEMDRDEVPARAYAQCVAQGHCAPVRCDDGSTPPLNGPARCIPWFDARAYCEYVGGRLPTEAEWERAAAGLLPTHRTFPWGDNHTTVPMEGGVAVRDVTPEGIESLGGGVAEWVNDVGGFYLVPSRSPAGTSVGDAGAVRNDAETITASDLAENEQADTAIEGSDVAMTVVDDPQGPREGPWRIVRGGNDEIPIAQWTTTRRRFRLPTDRKPWIGFRCVYDLR